MCNASPLLSPSIHFAVSIKQTGTGYLDLGLECGYTITNTVHAYLTQLV